MSEDPQQEQQHEHQEQSTQQFDQQQILQQEEVIHQTDQQKQQEDTHSISISVVDAQEKGSSLQKYTVYIVKGSDKGGDFEVARRFNEFFTLREVLSQRWPGLYIPPIPEKSLVGVSQTEIVAERKHLLSQFLYKLSQQQHLYYSEEFQTYFLRSKDIDSTKQLQALPKLSVADQVQRLTTVFGVIDNAEPMSEQTMKISNFRSFLIKTQTQMKNYIESAKSIVQAKQALRQQMLTTVANTLPLYEKETIFECIGSTQVLFTNQQFLTTYNQYKESPVNPIESIVDMFNNEVRDIDAMLQAYNIKDQISQNRIKAEQKLREEREELARVMMGKQSVKASLMKMTIEEEKVKLEVQIQESSKEVEQWKSLSNIVSILMATSIIDAYKDSKHLFYKFTLHEFASKEVEYLQKSNQLWQHIIDMATNKGQV